MDQAVVPLMPAMRAFARSLTRNRAEADDLLQDTLLRAIANYSQFQPGTNLKAWLFTILRNTHYTARQKKRRETVMMLDVAVETVGRAPPQSWSLAAHSLEEALHKLPAEQREVVVLVGGVGLSYEEAASVCGCAMGTIKSRLNRGRARLLEIMQAETSGELLDE